MGVPYKRSRYRQSALTVSKFVESRSSTFFPHQLALRPDLDGMDITRAWKEYQFINGTLQKALGKCIGVLPWTDPRVESLRITWGGR